MNKQSISKGNFDRNMDKLSGCSVFVDDFHIKIKNNRIVIVGYEGILYHNAWRTRLCGKICNSNIEYWYEKNPAAKRLMVFIFVFIYCLLILLIFAQWLLWGVDALNCIIAFILTTVVIVIVFILSYSPFFVYSEVEKKLLLDCLKMLCDSVM